MTNYRVEGNSGGVFSWGESDGCADVTTKTACLNIGSAGNGTYITTTDSGTGDWIQYGDPMPTPGAYIPITVTIPFDEGVKKDMSKDVEKRTLYKVYVVDPRKNGKVLIDGTSVIAINENQAMLKAGVMEVAVKLAVEIEDLDVYVDEIGSFIRPKRTTQKVRITKEED